MCLILKKMSFFNIYSLLFFYSIVQALPRGETVLNFSDAEELINDAELQDMQDEALEKELSITDRYFIISFHINKK